MKPLLIVGVTMLVLTTSSAVTAAEKPELDVVPSVDLDQYLGTWYENGYDPDRLEKTLQPSLSAGNEEPDQ